MDLVSYVNQVLPFAQRASAATGLPLDFVIAQSELETGAGSSPAALSGNNYFGISPGGSLASYPSIGAGFDAYGNLIQSRYPGVSGLSNPLQIGNTLQSSGYSTDPLYGSKIASLIPGVDSVLSKLGLSGGSSASATGSTSGQGGLLATIGDYVGRAGLMLLAIVVIGVALYMLGKRA